MERDESNVKKKVKRGGRESRERDIARREERRNQNPRGQQEGGE